MDWLDDDLDDPEDIEYQYEEEEKRGMAPGTMVRVLLISLLILIALAGGYCVYIGQVMAGLIVFGLGVILASYLF